MQRKLSHSKLVSTSCNHSGISSHWWRVYPSQFHWGLLPFVQSTVIVDCILGLSLIYTGIDLPRVSYGILQRVQFIVSLLDIDWIGHHLHHDAGDGIAKTPAGSWWVSQGNLWSCFPHAWSFQICLFLSSYRQFRCPEVYSWTLPQWLTTFRCWP